MDRLHATPPPGHPGAACREVTWASHCADLAVAHVKERTGRDIWGELGASPRSAREAADLFRRLGVRDLEGAVGRALGAPVPVGRAARGDVVLIKTRYGSGFAVAALGIVRGDMVECADGLIGIGRALCAWKVPASAPHAGR